MEVPSPLARLFSLPQKEDRSPLERLDGSLDEKGGAMAPPATLFLAGPLGQLPPIVVFGLRLQAISCLHPQPCSERSRRHGRLSRTRRAHERSGPGDGGLQMNRRRDALPLNEASSADRAAEDKISTFEPSAGEVPRAPPRS